MKISLHCEILNFWSDSLKKCQIALLNYDSFDIPISDLISNGSLFTYLPATVTVNGLENEMSSELRFQGRKWGVASRVHP